MNQKHKRTMTSLYLISILFIHFSSFSRFSPTMLTENLEPLKYEVSDIFIGSLRHLIQISNPTPSTVIYGELFVPLIRNETARHYVILYNISSTTEQPAILKDSSGNTIAYWNNVAIKGRQSLTVEISYYVLSFSTHYLINSSLAGEYDKNSDLYKKYTRPEPLIQSDDSEIVAKAQNLTSNLNDTLAKITRIYNFVVANIRYAVQDEERGALWALKNKTGDCSEYSYLFVALCRAIEIPARIQAGFAFHFAPDTTEDGHMWAEYYMEDYGWIPVDATWRLFNSINDKHFSSVQSMPEAIPYANYAFNSTQDSELKDEQTVKLEPLSPTIFDDDSLAENMMKSIQKVKQANTALSTARILGAAWIFQSETRNAEQALMRSKILIQKAIDSWDSQSTITEAYVSAEEATRHVWMLVTEEFALLIGILSVSMLIALVISRRH